MSDIEDDQGQQLFKDFDNIKDEEDDDANIKDKETTKKRLKKHKKEKEKKKKRHHDYDEEDEEIDSYEDNQFRSLIDEEASQGSDEEDGDGSSVQFEDEQERKRYQQIYNLDKKRETEKFMDRIDGKDENQINRLYFNKALKRNYNQQMLPSDRDDKMYMIGCKIGREEDMVLAILNKCSYYAKSNNAKYKMQVTSAMAMKKKYPGKIFIESKGQKQIKESLDGLIDLNIKKITPLDSQFYTNLFEAREDVGIQFKENQFVRIKKGVYEGDLAKICKIRKSNAEVALVPRINIQDILMKMRQETSKYTDEKTIIEKKDEILKKYTNPRIYYPSNLRPPKKPLSWDSFKEFSELPYNKRIVITPQGLILMSFRYDEIAKPQGTFLPIELQPFSKNGNMAEEFQDDEQRKNVISTIIFAKGDEAQIIVGQLTGCFGTVVENKENTVTLKCKNKDMAGKIIEQHIDHLAKRFKEGQRVKVVSGTDKGKTGLILKINGAYADIWTDNENSISINRNNLQIYKGQAISQDNLLGIKKDDLIKTTKGDIGVVISTNKDNIKMLDVNNVIRIVGNLDFESKINTHNTVAKNRNGDQIKSQTIVRIRKGIHQGSRCEVKHVYRDYIFVFNAEFDKTSGMYVQRADNCTVVAKATEGYPRKNNFKTVSQSNPSFSAQPVEDDLKVGKSIVIGSGPLKGYRGIIKSINKERIEVRVPQKNCTEWINRDKISQSQSNNQHGRTPRRGLSMTAMYAQSPMTF